MAFDELIVSFFVDEVVGGFFVSVPPGHIACIHDLGRGVLKTVWRSGLHLKIPFWQKAKIFNAQVLEYTIREEFNLADKEALGDEPLDAKTSDDQEIAVEGSILFKIDKNRAPELWENIGENFVSKVVRPVSRSRIRSCLASCSLTEILNHRLEVEKKLQNELNEVFIQMALVANGVLLSKIKVKEKNKNLSSAKVVFEKEQQEQN